MRISTDSSKPVFVGIGELLWDCFDTDRRPGGAPANTAFHAHQLGCESYIFSRVGRDRWGDALIQYIGRKGLAIDYIQRDPEHPTGEVTVDTSRPEAPTYHIHENVAWDYIGFGPAEQDLMARTEAVCFGTLAQRNSVSRRAVYAAIESVKPSTLVVYDVNLRQSYFHKDWIERSLVLSSIVKLNIEEAEKMADILAIGPPEPKQFAEVVIQKYGIETVCITRAAEGCLLISGSRTVDVPGQAVQVVDTVGAGDAFNAALVLGHLRGLDLDAIAHFSNALGGLVASRAGGMPELGTAIAELKAQFGID